MRATMKTIVMPLLAGALVAIVPLLASAKLDGRCFGDGSAIALKAVSRDVGSSKASQAETQEQHSEDAPLDASKNMLPDPSEDDLAKFRAEYITPAGRLVSDTQTAAALMLYFDLLEEKDRQKVLDRLELNLIKTQKHLRTGFVGTQYITHTLSQNGLHDLMGDILFKDDCPSWLYSVKLGATTIWELWDGVNPDGSFNLFEMNSLNQFGFGSIGDWLYKELCGITALAPGYKKSRIAPRLVKGITSVNAVYETVYGPLSCKFACEKGWISADIHVPENTTAVIALPEREEITVGSGDYHFEYATQLSFEKERYTMDSTLNSLTAQPAAAKMFMDEMPELAQSGFIRGFAGGMSIVAIEKTMPRSMVPTKAVDLFKRMIRELNRLEREGAQSCHS